MKRGTKSLLFGVHQFLWHPITVARAWKWIYRRNPNIYEWIAIFCHDLGYFGKPDMDGPEGQTHPEAGARIARRLAYWAARLRHNHNFASALADEVHDLALFHSTHYAQTHGAKTSALYLPDMAAILTDPAWFYLLRGWLSGEVQEYFERQNRMRWQFGEEEFKSHREWRQWYQSRIAKKVIENGCQCDICHEK
jgi:hypothetical protein